MILCRAENISRHYTSEPVFADLSFQIETGDRIGLVGPNGAGKSTLARVLLGKDAPDSGAMHFHADLQVAMLEQFPNFPPERTLIQEAKSAMSHLEHWYHEMLRAGDRLAAATEENERKRWAGRYDHFQELLRQHGGYEFDHRIEEVLHGLGFTEADFLRPLATFSGGQQSRVLLGKLLLQSPDLMILDEPTNHLDIETTEWLESYLVKLPTAMVIISHDRYFLDATVNKIFELHRGRLAVYPGNYQAYVKGRAERQKVLERIDTKQREAIAHYEDFVRRNKSGQLAKQAKSREKMIARIEADRVETVSDIEGPIMGFGEVSRTGDIVIATRDLSKAYDQTLFANLNLEVERGQRLAIIGPNGAGKTTLLRILLGEEPPTRGEVKLGHNVKIGYLDQSLDSLDLNRAPLEVARPPWRVAEKDEPFRALLARFGIGADLAEQKLRTMSGGERTRVALARLSCFEFNLLVLDEPTNHLDLWACEALERSLREFDGTVLVVSHDRYFLNQIADRLLYIHDGKVKLILGNYDRFVEERQRAAAAPAPAAARKEKTAASLAEKPAKRKRKFPYRKTTDIERDISDRESRIAELEDSLSKPDVYKDGRKLDEISATITTLKRELEQLMEHWAEAMELNAS